MWSKKQGGTTPQKGVGQHGRLVQKQKQVVGVRLAQSN